METHGHERCPRCDTLLVITPDNQRPAHDCPHGAVCVVSTVREHFAANRPYLRCEACARRPEVEPRP